MRLNLFTRVLSVALLLTPCCSLVAQDWAKKRLEDSPRHQEWVDVKHGDRVVHSFVMYPEVKDKATAVILIHEIFGLSDWVKGMTDQFAEAGYIAIAPDLLSGMGKDGGGTETFEGRDSVRAVSTLPADQVTADLNSIFDYVSKLPSCNGKVAVAGFCWGGTQSFRYATNNSNIKAAMVFYGSGPKDAADIAKINCPVLGFYGENDNRINATIDESKQLIKEAKKSYEPVIYKGAGHGFMRAGEEPEDGVADKVAYKSNSQARADAWKRIKQTLAGL